MNSINNEIELEIKSFLVSETDEEGMIKFANDEFCEFSEYSLEELIGQNHNIVRHPDMPAKTFQDLWDTIKSGKRWKGFVKNKSKTGKFYWVYATVYPYTSCDGSKGYISCRRKASRDEIEKYSNIYKQMK
ncbi:PAS sensor domain-containing protein [Malaciobacter halophilus]|uniref:PAS sensor domain-containing protein n=1 Tax=Malaciobacter halophilus TaxID=197482 RepID=A0A2N1J4X0_9BACT|nr:PAS domain-containing protein [Malaciobacter halophilus]AXH09617.1 PAS sensor-containing signal transduction protein [Malaciobacter halophilus]PKI81615.1 PAS sensor domain-containing protein [Malaciobacter halophilus]